MGPILCLALKHYSFPISKDKWFLRMGFIQKLTLNSRIKLGIHTTLNKLEAVLNSISLTTT